MATQYTDLQGAFGRQAHYRPRRFRARELLSPQADPRLSVADGEYAVIDISSNGASVVGPADTAGWEVGQEFKAALRLHGQDAQEVRLRVVRSEHNPRGGMRVGLAVVDSVFDLEAARQVDARTQLDRQLSESPQIFGSLVPADLRAAIADAVHIVQYYKRCLEPHEANARTHGEGAVRELAEKTYVGLRPAYAELRERASAAAEVCMSDRRLLQAAKLYTETVLTPLLLSAPMINRSYVKPLGYPGDYQVMLYYYDNAFEGSTAFAKAFHKLFVEHPLSAGVCSRKDFVVSHLVRGFQAAQAAQLDSTFQVTSLGCGPGREVPGVVEALREWPGTLHFRLIDQEERTLQVAYDSARRAFATSPSRAHIECLNLAFGQLLKNPSLLAMGGPQDFMYSTGLFDYLRDDVARELILTLYSCLKPGGTLLIANARGPNRYFFCPEFVLDWTLIYRTKAEMQALAGSLPSDAMVDVELEPGEAYWFLRAQKPSAR
jgi:hypothetical protein